MFRNIIWDVDGTLFDTYPAIARAFQTALQDVGKEASLEWVTELARISLNHCVATLADHYQLNADQLGQAFGNYYDQAPPENQPPFPGVIQVCEYICGVGGKNVIVTHRGRASTNELLAAHHMSHYFAGCIARDDGYPKKPHPASFEAAMKVYGLPSTETLAVGDRDIDVLAGNAAGIFTCLFGSETNDGTANLKISRFDELYWYLKNEMNELR